MSPRAFRSRLLLAVLLPLSAAGCKTWEPAARSPVDLIREERPSSIRVTGREGVPVTLRNPTLVNDSIVSNVAPPPNAAFPPPRVGVVAADIQLVEVPRLSPGRTIALAGAIAAASIGWARIQGSSGGTDERPGPLPKDPALSLTGVFRLLRGLF
jgi:hypothetical protein